jgi:predicted amidohydrolase
MRVGVYQNHPIFGETQANVAKTVQDLSSINAQLVVLPELFNTGYQFVSMQEVDSLAEDIPSDDTCQAMMSLARDREMHLVFGMAEKSKNRIYNSAVLVGPDGFIGKYRKAHLFLEEKDFFSPGDTGFNVYDIGLARVGIMICFDWWFPEAARTLALGGADIICHPANLVLPHCQEAMKIRALENGVFAITANRVGTEARGGKDPLTFTGESQIVDNSGEIRVRMSTSETGPAWADIDPALARDKSLTARNDRFIDRRPEFYDILPES